MKSAPDKTLSDDDIGMLFDCGGEVATASAIRAETCRISIFLRGFQGSILRINGGCFVWVVVVEGGIIDSTTGARFVGLYNLDGELIFIYMADYF
jgi:hypothetical protein